MRWRAGLLAACAWLASGRTAAGVELRSLDTEAAPDGAVARLVLSEPVRAVVRDVPGDPGTVLRLYVDLPRGTRLATDVPRSASATPPIARFRVGGGEGGAVRVVLELEGAATYHVERADRGRVITLAVTPRVEAPAGPAPPLQTAARPLRLRSKIVIDAGHGGSDPGAHGFAVEKDVTLAIARRLAALLAARLDVETVLTRTRDVSVPLAARTARANAEGADLFLSIHANASPSSRLRGVETYYLNNSDDRATIRLASIENGVRMRARPRGRTDLRYILSDLVQVGKMDESIALAGAVQRGLVARLQSEYDDVVDLGVKQGPFYVLVGAHMPCVLVETSFLTHPAEGRRMRVPAYREAVAEGLFAGVARFLEDARRARTL